MLGAQTFVYRNEKFQSYYVGIRWREGGEPEILGTSVSDLSEIKFTEKGYFIYTFENPVRTVDGLGHLNQTTAKVHYSMIPM